MVNGQLIDPARIRILPTTRLFEIRDMIADELKERHFRKQQKCKHENGGEEIIYMRPGFAYWGCSDCQMSLPTSVEQQNQITITVVGGQE